MYREFQLVEFTANYAGTINFANDFCNGQEKNNQLIVVFKAHNVRAAYYISINEYVWFFQFVHSPISESNSSLRHFENFCNNRY